MGDSGISEKAYLEPICTGELGKITWDKVINVGPMLTSDVKDRVLGGDRLDEVVEMHQIEKGLTGRPTQEVGREGVEAAVSDCAEFWEQWEQFPSWESYFESGGLLGMHDRCQQVLELEGCIFQRRCADGWVLGTPHM